MSKAIAVDEPVLPMTREEYRAWAEQQPRGRFERINGIVVQRDGASAMAPERSAHNQRKMLAWLALHSAIEQAGLPCQAQAMAYPPAAAPPTSRRASAPRSGSRPESQPS